ncbi:hypothetical protein FRC08_001224 [Ceratobasidium sp. 394]|nr:hypothetical protein FRC08_001224 [Ceratobasidium sp. 394]KAG9083435.1 hypothetical protein FS749_006032 [Ceratobasidium sp. UAMH 11750]
MMIKKGIVLHITGLVDSKDKEMSLMALGFVEELLQYDDSRQQLLESNIASILATPLNSGQSELVEAALDVAVAITSQSDSVEEALVDILLSLARKTKSHKAMLAIGGVATHHKLEDDLGTLISAFVTFTEDSDNTMVEDALNILIKLAKNDEHRGEMFQAHIIQSLTRLLELATNSSSYYSPSTSRDRIAITLKTFNIVEILCKDREGVILDIDVMLTATETTENIRAQFIQSPAIGFLYSLTDSPVSYTVDEAATATLRRMKYEDVQSALEKLDRERGLDVLSQIRPRSPLSVSPRSTELEEPVASEQNEQSGEAEQPEAPEGLSRPTTATDGVVIDDPFREDSTDRLVTGSYLASARSLRGS